MTDPAPAPATVARHVRRRVDEVFRTLTDPHTYPDWLVGCREIRSVDAAWPAPGSAFHHRVGLIGPLTVADSSEVLEIEPPIHLALEVRMRPLGRGRVDFRLTEELTSDGAPVTRIEVAETPIGLLRPTEPTLRSLIKARNEASLNALVALLNRP